MVELFDKDTTINLLILYLSTLTHQSTTQKVVCSFRSVISSGSVIDKVNTLLNLLLQFWHHLIEPSLFICRKLSEG